jgi:hypothetical protein
MRHMDAFESWRNNMETMTMWKSWITKLLIGKVVPLFMRSLGKRTR